MSDNERKGPNFPYGETVTYTVVVTSELRWGSACHSTSKNPLHDALQAAGALRPNLRKGANAQFDLKAIKPKLRIMVKLVVVKPEHRCAPDTVELSSRIGLILKGYKPGDVVPPFVTQTGDVAYRGESYDLGQINT